MGKRYKKLWKENKALLITVEIQRCTVATFGHLRSVNSLRLFRARLVFLGSKQSRRTTLNNEGCECGSAGTKGYEAHFGVQKKTKSLKEISEKRKAAVFRKRVSAKTAVFSVFKSVKSANKSDDTLTARRRRALV